MVPPQEILNYNFDDLKLNFHRQFKTSLAHKRNHFYFRPYIVGKSLSATQKMKTETTHGCSETHQLTIFSELGQLEMK